MVWYGMVWYGMVWYGMGCYAMLWYGMLCYAMVWYGRNDAPSPFPPFGCPAPGHGQMRTRESNKCAYHAKATVSPIHGQGQCAVRPILGYCARDVRPIHGRWRCAVRPIPGRCRPGPRAWDPGVARGRRGVEVVWEALAGRPAVRLRNMTDRPLSKRLPRRGPRVRPRAAGERLQAQGLSIAGRL
jgi:hypothetical protein